MSTAPVLANNLQVGALTPEQGLLADQLANEQAWTRLRNTQRSQPSSQPNATTSSQPSSQPTHPLGIQTLSVERDEGKKGQTQSRARVYQFNYLTQQSRLVIVDVETASISKIQLIDTVHLPLNTSEIEQARTLIAGDDNIMSMLNQIQQARGFAPLTNLSTIDVKASIFEPDDALHACASKRCALVSMFDQTRTVFTVEPLVNLQTLSVTTLSQSN